MWFAEFIELGIPYTAFEADANFEMNDMMAKSAKGCEDDVKIEEVPVTVTVGVTGGSLKLITQEV